MMDEDRTYAAIMAESAKLVAARMATLSPQELEVADVGKAFLLIPFGWKKPMAAIGIAVAKPGLVMDGAGGCCVTGCAHQVTHRVSLWRVRAHDREGAQVRLQASRVAVYHHTARRRAGYSRRLLGEP